MCQIFVGADPALYQARSRSLRLHGVATSLRLENLFWVVLEDIAARDGLRMPALVARLHDELVAAGGDAANFTSFLRVSCLRYLGLQLHGDIPNDGSRLSSLDAARVLASERRRRGRAELTAYSD